MGKLKQKFWATYINFYPIEYEAFKTAYEEGKEAIQHLVEKAEANKTKWEDTIEIFNQRFSVPFKVSVSNQADAILKKEMPKFEFDFNTGGETPDIKKVDKEELKNNVLSQGEKRALYLLDIIYERLRNKGMHAGVKNVFY